MNQGARFSLASLALAALAAVACEDQLSPAEAPSPSLDTMPRLAPRAEPSAAPASAVVEVVDAGVRADDGARHAVIVSSCAIDRGGCLLAQPSSPPPDSSYRVVFGGGVGAIRTRQQAMAELYKEIRDRTEAGARLVALTHPAADQPPAPDVDKAAARSRAGIADEPLVEATYQLIDAADRDGEVTIDSLDTGSPSSCKLSLGTIGSDGGAARCLINPPASGPLDRTPGRRR